MSTPRNLAFATVLVVLTGGLWGGCGSGGPSLLPDGGIPFLGDGGPCPVLPPSTASCTNAGLACAWESQVCVCTTAKGCAALSWVCGTAHAQCPATTPTSGTACTLPDNAECPYASVQPTASTEGLLTFDCSGGMWIKSLTYRICKPDGGPP
jgi:hypothetical protein